MVYSLKIPGDLVSEMFRVREKTGVSIRRQVLEGIMGRLQMEKTRARNLALEGFEARDFLLVNEGSGDLSEWNWKLTRFLENETTLGGVTHEGNN
jgi:hypothetical protein